MIRVLIVDHSALMRYLLSEMLKTDTAITVVGTAADAYEAREKIKQLSPDVVTLDTELPGMSGITFLRNLMRLHPVPVLVISVLTTTKSSLTQTARESGAADIMVKPHIVDHQSPCSLAAYTSKVCQRVKMIAGNASLAGLNARTTTVKPVVEPVQQIIAIGASTGGTEAIKTILTALPANMPPIVVVQHMPQHFTQSLAARLNKLSQLMVSEARHNEVLQLGHVYLAPGDYHLQIVSGHSSYVCQVNQSASVNGFRPSVDILFNSVAVLPCQLTGVLLTGMGKDGAAGLKQLRNAGALTIAQDEASSIVWGMPSHAVKLEAVQQVLPLKSIPSQLIQQTKFLTT